MRMTKLLLCSFAVVVCTTVANAGLLGLYQFENTAGTSGSIIADTSGYAHDGTVVGGDVSLVPSVTGSYGNAADFGTGGRVQAILTNASTNFDDFSVAFWTQSNDLNASYTYITAREGGGGNQISAIYEYVDDTIELYGGAYDVRTGSQMTVADLDWHHVVYTRTGGVYDKYLDGVKTNIPSALGPYAGVTKNLVMGDTWDGLGHYNGKLDDVAWFDNGLDQAQVNTIMSGDFSAFYSTPPEPPPVPEGVLITGVTYTYDNIEDLELAAGKDTNYGSKATLDGSNGALTDGLGREGEYTPAAAFWGSPEEGTIFYHQNGNIPSLAQPQITFDLGEVHDLEVLVFHYGVHQSAGIFDPSAVDILVDGTTVGTMDEFIDSATQPNNTILSNAIDLTGEAGQYITLQLRGTPSETHAGSWLGVMEVEIFEVPEPSSFLLALFGLAGMGLYRRKK